MTISNIARLGPDIDIKILCLYRKNFVAETCGVTIGQVRRWLKSGNFPDYAQKLIALEAGYFPWPEFSGWQVANGLLFSPNLKYGFAPGDIEAIHYLKKRLALLERENAAPAQYLMDI